MTTKPKTAKAKMIKLRLPKDHLAYIKRIAKLANVTPTQVFNVMLAANTVAMTANLKREGR